MFEEDGVHPQPHQNDYAVYDVAPVPPVQASVTSARFRSSSCRQLTRVVPVCSLYRRRLLTACHFFGGVSFAVRCPRSGRVGSDRVLTASWAAAIPVPLGLLRCPQSSLCWADRVLLLGPHALAVLAFGDAVATAAASSRRISLFGLVCPRRPRLVPFIADFVFALVPRSRFVNTVSPPRACSISCSCCRRRPSILAVAWGIGRPLAPRS